MAATGLVFGDEVIIPWGVDEVRGTVREVYGTRHASTSSSS